MVYCSVKSRLYIVKSEWKHSFKQSFGSLFSTSWFSTVPVSCSTAASVLCCAHTLIGRTCLWLSVLLYLIKVHLAKYLFLLFCDVAKFHMDLCYLSTSCSLGVQVPSFSARYLDIVLLFPGCCFALSSQPC